jgi:hypothetical protein
MLHFCMLTCILHVGVMGVANGPDGSDRHMTCNHLGPFLLTRLMEQQGLLRRGSHVVNVASRAQKSGSLSFTADGQQLTTPPASQNWWWVMEKQVVHVSCCCCRANSCCTASFVFLQYMPLCTQQWLMS